MPPPQKRVFIDLTQEPHLDKTTADKVIVVQGSDSDEEDIPRHMTNKQAKKRLKTEIDTVLSTIQGFREDRTSDDYQNIKMRCREKWEKYDKLMDEIEKKCLGLITKFKEFEKELDKPDNEIMKNQILSGHVITTQIHELNQSITVIQKQIQKVLAKEEGHQSILGQLLKQ